MAFCFTCLLVLLFKTERIYHENFVVLFMSFALYIFCTAQIHYMSRSSLNILAIASEECFVCLLVLAFRERNNFIQVKTYHCIVFTDFQCAKLYSFYNFTLRFILKIFLNFANFSLDILIKYILIKKKECNVE